jgi:hypothetical protein
MSDGFDEVYVDTRRQLRGVAESLIAGPQYRAAGTIRLAVRPDGFAAVAIPLAVHGTELVWPNGAAVLTGPVDALADAAGVDGRPTGSTRSSTRCPPTRRWPSTPVRRTGSTELTTQAGMRSRTSCPTSTRCFGPSTSTSRPPRTR